MKINSLFRNDKVIVTILLCLIVLQTTLSMSKKTVTVDEIFHISRGYLYLKTGELTIIHSPPLINIIASLPLFFFNPTLPINHYNQYLNNFYSDIAYDFFYKLGNNPELITFTSRIPIVLLSVLLGFGVFKWAKKLYGKKAGLLALFLYSFCPNILAHSTLATTDLGASFFIFLALYSFWKFLNKQTWKNLILVGLTFGLAQVSKYTALSLIPTYILLVLFNTFRGPKKLNFNKNYLLRMCYALSIIFVIGIIVINIFYGFEGSFKSLGKNLREDNSQYFDKSLFNSNSITNAIAPNEGIMRDIVYFAIEHAPMIIPYPYLKDVYAGQKTRIVWRGGFLNGKVSKEGWWYYFLFAFLVKTPIPMLLLLILSILFFKKIKHKNMLNEYLIILFIIIHLVYWSLNKVNTGIRYLLVIYPLLFVFVSKVVNINRDKKKMFNMIIVALCVWYFLSSILIFPHYLAYFNELVGGPDNGYKYLVNSNLDWGQDLKGLKHYMDKKNIDHVKLAYFGMASPNHYNISYDLLAYFFGRGLYGSNYKDNCTPTNGIIAISATYLQGDVDRDNSNCFKWLKKYKPTDKIGYSIFVYDIK